jgi:uncharacterized protein
MFSLIASAAAFLAAAIAAVAGFGIGSILTPLLAARFGTKLAVAAVSIPHLVATLLRFLIIRQHVDQRVFVGFGLTSAAGGLLGALFHARFSGPILSYILGGLLVFAGLMNLTGWSALLHFAGPSAWIAGAVSGAFGGLVGNQGGIRSAAMLGMNVPKQSFVATATAIALIVDGARMPVYAALEWRLPGGLWPIILITVVAVIPGTVAGERLLRQIPAPLFRRVVAVLIFALGVSLLFHPG